LSDHLISSVKQLIQLGKGDTGRLEYILDMLKKDSILPISDQKYLENIISLNLGGQDSESAQRKNEHAIDYLQKEIQNLNLRILKLERHGFERYVGKKTVFFFVTVFVGWNALSTYGATFFNMFLPENSIQYIFPLNFLTVLSGYPIVQFAFFAIIYAWVFIGLHLVRFIKSRKIST